MGNLKDMISVSKQRVLNVISRRIDRLIPISFENATHQQVAIVGATFTSHVGKKQTISLNPPPSVADSWENECLGRLLIFSPTLFLYIFKPLLPAR